MRALPLILVILLASVSLVPWPGEDRSNGSSKKDSARQHHGSKSEIDFTQAELMLDFLQHVTDKRQASKKIEPLLNAVGTGLILRQLNIARKVSKDQYRQILTGLVDNKRPVLKPVDASERAARGVSGLERNIWPILEWAVQNTASLEEKLESLKRFDLYAKAQKTALRFLPEPVNISPGLYIVMGGKAGAAALSDDHIYLDVLLFDFLAQRGTKAYPSQLEVMEFFAHEMHHIGYNKILKRFQAGLKLDSQQRMIFRFLSSLLMEGSATFLINGHRNIKRMLKDPMYADDLKKGNDLLRQCGNVLQAIAKGEIQTDEAFDKATSFLLGSGYHAAGSLLLDQIYRKAGLKPVLKVMSDPRKLLIQYNRAVQEEPSNPATYRFPRDLETQVSQQGHNR